MRFSPTTVRLIIVCAVACLAGGCTSVKFTDAAGTNVGFEYYPAKPYVLVQPDAKGVRRASVVSFPDVTQPRRVKHVPGWGTVSFNFKLSNGMITEWGEKYDSKGPETIAAATSGFASVLSAVAPLSAAADGSAQLQIKPVQEAADLIQTGVIDVLTPSGDPGLAVIESAVVTIKAELNRLTILQIRPQDDTLMAMINHRKSVALLIPQLETEFAALKLIKDNDRTTSDVRVLANRAYTNLSNAIKKLKGYVHTPASVELYEIIEENGDISFERVYFPS